MKEPEPRPIDPSRPRSKDVIKHRMLPTRKPEWDIAPKDDGLFSSTDLDKINDLLDESSDENSENSN